MGLDQGAGDGQADPGAAVVSVTGGVAAVEAFEDLRQVFGTDALAGVGDYEGQAPAAVGGGAQGDGTAGRGVAQGVGEQVAQYLAYALPVHLHGSGCRPGVHL